MGETEQILISKIYHETFEEEKKQVYPSMEWL